MSQLSRFLVTVLFAVPLSSAATLVASYDFNNTLSALQAGDPTLTAVDPLGTSGFLFDSTLNRNVWQFLGSASPTSDQGGLSLDTSTLLADPTSYSIQVFFEFFDRDLLFRRILDVAGRSTDNGFYVDPNNQLDVFPDAGGGPTFFNGFYEDVFLTVDSGVATAYLNSSSGSGVSSITNVMDISTNPINFFLDNTVGSGLGEYSTGRVAFIQVFDGALSASDVVALDQAGLPPQGVGTVPEPATWALLLGGIAAAIVQRRFTRRAAPAVR